MTRTQKRIPGYCALCVSSCGCISVVEDGKLVAVEPDPEHPTGQSLCGKGLAAPDHVYSEARVLYPMKRTRPKGEVDPGWKRISWEEALDTTADAIRRIRSEEGAESIAFSITTSAGTAMQDGYPFIERLRHAIGTPNAVASIELCAFARDFVYPHTFGVSTPTSEVENSDCIILWGHNPGTSWLAFATRIAAAHKRGARLIVMDPVRVGFATKAEQWLRVRPGSDGALALSLAHIMIDEQLFDHDFVSTWTNGPFLVRDDTGAMLTGADLDADGDLHHRIVWDSNTDAPLLFDTGTGTYVENTQRPFVSLRGHYRLEGLNGPIACRPVFDLYAELCARYPPESAAEICWLDAAQIRETAHVIGGSKAVSCYTWAGLEMHSNTSQTGRAIACLYALTGCFDAPGGNVIFEHLPVQTIFGEDMLSDDIRKKSLGRELHPLGPEAIFGWITSDSLYKAILEREPYGVSALISFGLNLIVSHADGDRGQRALNKLEFMAHADLFMTPTAEHADIFLPVNTPWERDGLRTDFCVDQKASTHVQLRQQIIESRGESRSDAWIAAELARRLGLGDVFWDGNLDDARRELLSLANIDLAELANKPRGISVPLSTRYRKYAERRDGSANGFETPSRRVELFSETLFAHGYPALPDYVEPTLGPFSRPDLADDFPLVLTDAKSPHFIHSQYRHIGRLRRHEREPRIYVHPETATTRGINDGDWVCLTTPHGSARMRARFAPALDRRVVRATAGWWQSCESLSLPGYDAKNDRGSNLNRTIGHANSDPIGGCVPHKSYLCELIPALD